MSRGHDRERALGSSFPYWDGKGRQPISLTVLGRPQPAGSKRAFPNRKTGGVIVTDDSKKSRPWKQQVAGQAFALVPSGQMIEGPVALYVRFVLARPKGHFRTGRNAHLLRDTAPPYPIVKPDTTKLLRAVEDALTGIVWRDDAQVVEQSAWKFYGLPERCEILVQPATDWESSWPVSVVRSGEADAA